MSTTTVKRAYKYRFYPTPEQAKLLARTFGCIRVVWNNTLEWRQRRWQIEKIGTSYSDANSRLTEIKHTEELEWLNEVSSVPLQQVLRHQQNAMTGFFDRRSGYPKFKSRKSRQSAEFTKSAFSYRDGNIYMAKSREPLAIIWTRDLPDEADPSSIIISKDKANRYFVSILVEEKIKHLPKVKKDIALDLGVSEFAVTSDGEHIVAPKFGRKAAPKIARLQRRLTKKQPGSKNREKARVKVARENARVADQRRAWLHDLSTRLIRENQTIYLEDLSVASMSRKGGSRKKGLNRSIQDAAMSAFRGMIEYKADWYGREVITIPRFEPSTQLCSKCGAKTGPRGISDLGVRGWICSNCGAFHDRDENAASNILAVGRAVAVCGDGRRLR